MSESKSNKPGIKRSLAKNELKASKGGAPPKNMAELAQQVVRDKMKTATKNADAAIAILKS